MSVDPIRYGASAIDLSGRVRRSATVAGSPAAAAETTVCQVTIPGGLAVGLGVILLGFCTLTVGASGTAVTTKLRQTDTSGTTIVASGATTVTAGNLVDRAIVGVDTSPALTGQTYVLTLTITAGAATSTVTAAQLIAIVI